MINIDKYVMSLLSRISNLEKVVRIGKDQNLELLEDKHQLQEMLANARIEPQLSFENKEKIIEANIKTYKDEFQRCMEREELLKQKIVDLEKRIRGLI